ncbi:hypothetical protein [Gimesia sp.]|uniref:hypothetical protein n=1 Tax=Gimesia sp. TaxID=2024833 RepID=UPI0032EFF164
MPINRMWNNILDAAHIVITRPTSQAELKKLGFPTSSSDWLACPSALPHDLNVKGGEIIFNRTAQAAADCRITLQKIEPEDLEINSPSWYVVFETEPQIACRLDLSSPDWGLIEQSLKFSISSAFVSFTEAWPGLVFESLERPAFLLPCSEWLRHESLSLYDEECRPIIDLEMLAQLRHMLLFQIDYWATAKLLDCDGIVWEYKIDKEELISTDLEFTAWIKEAISFQLDRGRKEN